MTDKMVLNAIELHTDQKQRTWYLSEDDKGNVEIFFKYPADVIEGIGFYVFSDTDYSVTPKAAHQKFQNIVDLANAAAGIVTDEMKESFEKVLKP